MENRPKLTRRDFLRGAALAGVGATIAACAPAAPAPAPAAPAAAPTKAAAAPAAPAAAPAAAQEAKIRFISNHGEADVPLFKKVLANFAAANPKIQVEYLDIAGTEFYNAINTQGAGGQLPDVWYTRTFDVPVYGSKNWTVDLQPLVDRDAKEVNVDDFWPAQVAQMKWKGHLYALPYDFSNMAIYYNKKMFDDAKVAYPANDNWKWDEVLQTGLKFVKKEGNQIKNYALNMGFVELDLPRGHVRLGRQDLVRRLQDLAGQQQGKPGLLQVVHRRPQAGPLSGGGRHAAGRQPLRRSTGAHDTKMAHGQPTRCAM